MKTVHTEYDPLTGLRSDVQTDGRHVREVTITSNAHTQATLDHLQRLRNDENYSKDGIKNGWHHAASIPMSLVLEWMNEGFNVFQAHPTEILKRLRQRDYERLRATSGRI